MDFAGSHANTANAAAAAANGARPAPMPQAPLERLMTFDKWENEELRPSVPVECQDMDELQPMKVGVFEDQPQPQRPARAKSGQLKEQQQMQDNNFGMGYPGMPPGFPPFGGGMPGMQPPWPMMGYPGYPMFPPQMYPGMYMPQMGMGMQPTMGMGPSGHSYQAGAGPGSSPAKKAKGRGNRRGNKAKGKEDEDSGGNQHAADTDGADAHRSDELVQVRKVGATKCKLPLAQALPHIQEFARDQHGSRFLQTKLESADTTQDEKAKVFEAILPEADKLAGDAFAHFVVQKLFEIGTADQNEALVAKLKDSILDLCKASCGCRVIQKAIHHLQRESQLVIAKELEKDVIGCIEDPHGNHVIQKCIEQMNPDSVRFIVEKVEKRTYDMATHMYGCRVIQRLLEHFSVNDLGVMLARILEKVPDLAKDSYGNYVIQHMLEHSKLEDKKKIIMEVTRDVVQFSKLKHASNVVEKCFEVATQGGNEDLENERAALFESVLGKPGETCPLYQIVHDKYGNYIVQRMIEYSTRSSEKGALKQCLEARWNDLATNDTTWKHVEKAYKEHFGPLN
jgi:pumilio RNA-binding family